MVCVCFNVRTFCYAKVYHCKFTSICIITNEFLYNVLFLRLLCIPQDESKNASHDLGDTQSCQNQLQDTASTSSSLTVIYAREETQRQEQSVAELPREEIERKTVTLLEEYFGIEDLKVLKCRFYAPAFITV